MSRDDFYDVLKNWCNNKEYPTTESRSLVPYPNDTVVVTEERGGFYPAENKKSSADEKKFSEHETIQYDQTLTKEDLENQLEDLVKKVKSQVDQYLNDENNAGRKVFTSEPFTWK